MLIILNGVANAGKTSVARILQSRIPNTVHLEVDLLRGMFEWMPIDDAVPIAIENTVSILPNFLKRSMNVVIDYPLGINCHHQIMGGLPEGKEVYTFTLKPRLEVAIRDRGKRVISPEVADRIRFLYNSTDINDASLGTFIDNSDLTAEETAGIILKYIGLSS